MAKPPVLKPREVVALLEQRGFSEAGSADRTSNSDIPMAAARRCRSTRAATSRRPCFDRLQRTSAFRSMSFRQPTVQPTRESPVELAAAAREFLLRRVPSRSRLVERHRQYGTERISCTHQTRRRRQPSRCLPRLLGFPDAAVAHAYIEGVRLARMPGRGLRPPGAKWSDVAPTHLGEERGIHLRVCCAGIETDAEATTIRNRQMADAAR